MRVRRERKKRRRASLAPHPKKEKKEQHNSTPSRPLFLDSSSGTERSMMSHVFPGERMVQQRVTRAVGLEKCCPIQQFRFFFSRAIVFRPRELSLSCTALHPPVLPHAHQDGSSSPGLSRRPRGQRRGGERRREKRASSFLFGGELSEREKGKQTRESEVFISSPSVVGFFLSFFLSAAAAAAASFTLSPPPPSVPLPPLPSPSSSCLQWPA